MEGYSYRVRDDGMVTVKKTSNGEYWRFSLTSARHESNVDYGACVATELEHRKKGHEFVGAVLAACKCEPPNQRDTLLAHV